MKLHYYLAVVTGALSLSLGSTGFADQTSSSSQPSGVMQDSQTTTSQGAAGATRGATSSAATEGATNSGSQSAQMQDPDIIRQAQQRLNTEGYDAGPEDGVYGPRTQAALEKFQRDQGLSGSGELNQETLAALDMQTDDAIAGAGGEASEEGAGTDTGLIGDDDAQESAAGPSGSARQESSQTQ